MVKSAYSFSTKKEKIESHIIVVWVDNESGVLALVVGLFSQFCVQREIFELPGQYEGVVRQPR